MPRTKGQKQAAKRNRNSDEDGYKAMLKEMQRIHDEYESESTMIWQQRKEEVLDIIKKFTCKISPEEMEMTVGEWVAYKDKKLAEANATDSLLTEVTNGSVASKPDDDGMYIIAVVLTL